ncbi:MAG: DUF1073 domain-containing protein [Clostridiales bacterium]|jgi:hypothetical protein|nr:DUF1073 domain-containing protein [Clostridiales bacterium]
MEFYLTQAKFIDGIEEQQQAILRPILDKRLPIMCLSEFGAIPDDLDFEFEHVRRPSEEECENILTQTSTAIIGAVNEDIEKADGDFGIGGEPPEVMGVVSETNAERSVAEYEEQSEQK